MPARNAGRRPNLRSRLAFGVMAYLARKRRTRSQRVGPVEVICVLAVLAAVIALVVWVVTQAGGGHLLT
jgi:hypothetical protein